MKFIEVFSGAGPGFMIHPNLMSRFGLTFKACGFISFIGWKTIAESNRWVTMEIQEIESLTGLTKKEQIKARKTLRAQGLLIEHNDRLRHELSYKLGDLEVEAFQLKDSEFPEPKNEILSSIKEPCEVPERELGEGAKRELRLSNKKEEKRKRKISPFSKNENNLLTDFSSPKDSPQTAAAPRANAEPEFPPELQGEKFQRAWGEWTQHLRELRPRPTPSAIRKQLEKLGRMGEARAIAAIERSIENYWRSPYEEQGKFQKQKDKAWNGEGNL